ncbi:MAG: hypothetical protein HC887_03645 [Desulfobacteraceae bacterium]|nr:hypothetical protein [Desulfobacteraceae bacterium]
MAARVESSANEESRLESWQMGRDGKPSGMNALEAQYARLKRAVDTDREFYDLIHKQIKSLDVRVGTISNNVTLVDAPSAAVKVRPSIRNG